MCFYGKNEQLKPNNKSFFLESLIIHLSFELTQTEHYQEIDKLNEEIISRISINDVYKMALIKVDLSNVKIK